MNNCYCCAKGRIEKLLYELRKELAEAVFKGEIKDETLMYTQYLPSNRDGYVTHLTVSLRPVDRNLLYPQAQGAKWNE